MTAEFYQSPDSSYSNNSQPTGDYDIRKFYDPAEKFRDEPLPAFIGRVAATRADVKIILDGRMQEIGGREVMAAELTHALIDIPEELARSDVETQAQQEVITATHEYADLIASTAVQLAEQIKGNNKSTESVLVLAAKILAATAHEKQERSSGLPYIEHPHRAASLFEIGWRRHMPNTPEANQMLDIHRFHIYLHDGYEDSIDATGEYLAQDKQEHLTVSPLILKKVLEKCNIFPPEGVTHDELAQAPLLMTRKDSFDGNKAARQPYDDYTDAGIEMGGPFFIAAKAPDTADNTNIEPPQDRSKIKKYTASINRYRQEATRYGRRFGNVVRTVFELTGDDIQKFKPGSFELKQMPAELRGTITRKIQERRKKQ